MWMRERCLPFRTWINVGVSTNVYVQVSILPIYLRACLQLKMKFWLVCPMDEWNAEIVNRTEVYRFSIHRPQSRRWYEPCCYLYIILLHSSKFCSHVPFTTGNTSILAYMDDDVESIQVRLGHIHIYSANLAMMMVRRWREKNRQVQNTRNTLTNFFDMTMSMTDDECKCRIGLKPIESA